jgi:hypothetical protein
MVKESEPGAVAMGSTLKLRVDRVATARRSDTYHHFRWKIWPRQIYNHDHPCFYANL